MRRKSWSLRSERSSRTATPRPTRLTTFAQRSLRFELLEDRRLLDAGLAFTHIIYDPSQTPVPSGGVAPAASPLSSSAPVGLIPTQIRTAYGVNLLQFGSLTGNGSGQTIAIIDAYDDPDLVSSTSSTFSSSDLHKFDQQFGLADPPSFTKLDENGGTNYPQASGSTGWSVEESLDVEWAHAMAPGANIVLIEANSTSYADLTATAVNTARNLAGVSVVSMSFGGSEFSGETSYDANFTTPSGHQGVTFVASTGDDGEPGGYPAYSPNVVAVGGTTLTLSGNNYGGETGWSGSGGGQSIYESKPSYQNSVQTSAYREIPDVAFDADPNSGVAVCDSYDYGSSAPWLQVGGTSLAAPCWAGLLAITNQLRVSQSSGTLDGPSQTLPKLYSLPASDFHDITSGSNGYSAGPGYDMVTGRGTPVANLLVPDLASYVAPDLTVAATHSGTFKQGDTGDTCTITVSNTGTAISSGTVSLVDALPTGLTATAISGTGWTVNLATLTATRSDALAAGGSYPAITLTVNVAANAPASATNTATVSGGGEINTTNDTASDPISIAQTIDLTIAASHSGNFKQGDVGDTYTITVSNVGFASTNGTASVVDTLPAGLTATAMTGAGWNVNLSTLTATRSDPLAAGGSYQPLTVTVNVAANAAASVTNTATVSGGGEINTANDTARDLTTVLQPDLAVAATHSGTFKQNDIGDAYTITVSNVGLSATNATVSVVDTLPAGLVATAMTGAGWTVNLATLTATRTDPLAAGGSYSPLTVTVNVASNAAASVTNTATVSGGGEINTANDTASDPTTIQQPDLTVSATHSGTFRQDDVGDVYTITASNAGLAPTASSVSLSDVLPAGLVATAMSGAGWTINFATLTATRSDPLAGGASYPSLTVTVNVSASAPTSVTNTATVSGGGETNTANDTASDVTAITPLPDLTVAATHSGTFKQGDTGDTCTITVTNSGSGSTSGTVSLSDALPAGLTATALSGTGWSVNLATLTATRSDALAAGGSYPALTLTVNVAASAPTSVTNTATVSGGGEASTGNDIATDAVSVLNASGPPSILNVTPSLTSGVLVAGSTTTLAMNFSMTVVGGGTAANYQLQSAGADGLLGTADDVFTSLAASYTGTTATLSFAALTPGVYRLTVLDTITDSSGHKLDGNGDGVPGGNFVRDFVVVAASNNPLFGNVTTWASSISMPTAIATGDFNGDGKMDLAVVNSGNNTVAVLLGNGNGTFTASGTFSSGGQDPGAIVAGDFNGDGKLDLAVANYDSSTIAVLLNSGNGTFATAVTYASGGSNPDALAVGDFNGDGKLDLAVTNNWGDNLAILTGNGNGTFNAATTYSVTNSFPSGIAVGDFNGDGHPDLAVSVTWGNLDVFLNNGNGTFAPAATYGSNNLDPQAIVAGDFNGDGRLDLALADNDNGTVGVFLGNGNGTFGSETTYSTGGTSPNGLVASDFNKDGNLDLAVTNGAGGTVGVLLGNGNGTFAAATTYSSGGSEPYGVASADFNGDGSPDLAVANEDGGSVGVLSRVFPSTSVTLASPGGYSFDVPYGGDGAGELIQGTANAFDGMNRLQVDGADYSPAVATANLADNGQTLLLPSQTLAGLTVSRKVTVPAGGGQDFARTVDCFQNATANSITTTVTIVGNLGSDAATTVFATSDGTGVVSTNDQWIGTDDATDGGGTPAVISYIRGPTGLKPTSVSLVGDNITWTYSLTVPAGQTVRLATFTIQSMSRATATAEANALVTTGGFGGEAGLLLTPAESASLLNFNFGVLSVTATSIDGGVLAQGADSLSVTFNKPVLGSATAANYHLQSAGPDGLLGTADDITIPITSAAAGNPATLNFSSLAPGLYRLTVFDTITDTSGNPLDGSGLPGSNYTRDFVVVPQPANSLFGTVSTVSCGGSPYSMAVGDFNGDGKLDLAVANGSNVVILLGNGSGGFAAPVTYSSGGSDPDAIVAGDFNGDGKLDLAVTNYNSNTIGVLLGNGDGTFAAAVTYASGGSNPYSIAVADVNGDGKQDIVLTNNWGNSVGVLLGNGNGTFAAVTTYSVVGQFPGAIAVGDFNGDGHPDLAVAVAWGNVDVFLNNGNGTFAAPVVYAPNCSNPTSIAVADFNGDGKLDLVVANNHSTTVSVLLGNGNGTFGTDVTYSTGGTTPWAVAVGDFNKDGIPDLAVTNTGSNTVSVLLGNGNGTFAAAQTYSTGGTGPYAVAAGDFNGDGYSDLIVGNQSSDTVGVMLRVFVPASVTLVSPGGYNFDVQYGGAGAGQLLQGTANAFDGMGRLQVGGADYAPALATVSLADNGQSVLLPTQTLAGLTVSRKVSVPNVGGQDFARTIDSFQNTTANSIATTVTILGNLGSDAATTVFATSDGTGLVSTNDQWIGTDDATDGGGTPAVISYIRGPGGLKPTSVSLTGDNIIWTYSLTVPAGQTVSLAMFTIQSMTRATAIAEANALTNGGGLNAEAALLLTSTQLAAIANFQFPGPTAIQLSATNVNEKQTAGALVGALSSTDTQSGATYTFSLPQNASYPDNASFSIDAAGNLRTAAVFNAQAQSSYTILVQSTDQYGDWLTKPFTITVNDITPPSVVLDLPGTTGPTNATSLVFTVVFSETVHNVAAGDFQLTATGTAAGAITSVSATSGTVFTVTVGSLTGDGTLRLDLMAGTTVQDAAGNVALPCTSGSTLTLDHTPPAIVSSTPSTSGPTTANNLTFTVVLSETVYAVTLGDFQLTTTGSAIGTLTSVSPSSGTTFTVAVVGIDGSGTLRLDLKSGSTILDAAGNVATGYTSGGTVTVVDTPATVTSITPGTAGPTNATSLTYGVVFSKNVVNVAAADFQLTATGTATGTVTSVSAASGSSFTVTVGSVTGDGTLRLDLESGSSVQDIAGAGVPGYAGGGVTTLDHTPPTVLSSTPGTPGPTTANTVAFTVVFSETVYNVLASDFQLTATGSALGTVTTVSAASGTTFTVTVAGIDGSGTLRMDLESGSTILDAAGNVATGYTSGGLVTVVDTPAAVNSITPGTAGPTNATSQSYSVVFNKNVYDVAAADFQLTATGTAAGSVTSVSTASGSSFTVTVGSITGDGTLRLDLESGSTIQDIAGAGVPGFTAGGTTTFQHTPPAVVSSTPSTPGPTNATSLGFTVVFSETVSNVALGDFQLTTTGSAVGTLSSVSAASGASFTVTVGAISGVGTLRLDLKAGTTIQDAAGNLATGCTSGGTVSIVIPVTVAAITPWLANGLVTAGANSLAVGFSQVVLGGGTVSNFQIQAAGPDGLLSTADDTTVSLTASYSGTTTTLSFSSLAAGVYRLTAFDTITDVAGNKIDGNQDGQPGGNWVHDFVVVPLNTATFPAANPTTLSTGSAPWAIATGDFNGDGVMDLVTANEASNNVSIFIGNGAGGFAAGATYPIGGSTPRAVAVGDFNGDGKLDLAVADYGSNTVSILLGNGDGGFSAPVTYATGGSGPDAVAVGDFNGDGKLDLAVANYASGTVGLLLGNGAGGFAAATTFSSGGSDPQSIAVSDFNGDNMLDLAVANSGSNTVGVLVGNGAGGFATATTFSSGGSLPMSLAVGDFNGDGKQDLAVANYGSSTVGVLLGNGSGGFAAATTFSSGGSFPMSLAVGDFNGDGKQDLVVANYSSNSVGVLLGNGVGGFATAASYASGGSMPCSLAVADFNGDGKQDFAVVNSVSNTVGVLLGNGTGAFGGTTIVSSGGSHIYSVAVGDFNGDGHPDLAMANFGSNTVSVLLGNGAGGFAAPVTYVTGGSGPDFVAVGDFNGDGKLDIVVANMNSGTVSVLLGNGSGGFATATTYSTGGLEPGSLAVGDFNGDGHLDLAVANTGSNTVGVLLGNGSGGLSAVATYSSGGSSPESLAIGDFNGDGKLDIALANMNSGTVGVLLGNGSGGFSAVTTYSSGGSNPDSLAAGDFNGDGKLDLAVANYTSNNVGVLLGNGSGGFAAVTTYSSGGSGPQSIAVGDFNGDGSLDLAVANYGSNTVGVLLGNGSGGFAAAMTYSSGGSSPFFIVAADFNGDGKLDLATANYVSSTVGVLLNTTYPVVQPLTSAAGTTYQVQAGGLGAGQIAAASNGAFNGLGRLRVAGQDYTPPLATAGLTNGNSTVVTPTVSMAGLYVWRKVTVPASGSQDFARTVDTFQNPTASPITTTVTIVGNMGSDAGTTVFATSDGTGVVSPNDQWIGIDNGSGSPAVIYYLHGPYGWTPSTVQVVGDNITWTYTITVPAGQKIELAYYTITAATRAAATSAASTLVTSSGFAGHAADYLAASDLGTLMNFAFHPLPVLTFPPGSGAGTYGGTASVTTTLTSGGQPLSNKTVSFGFNGVPLGTATTDVNGTATLTNISLAGLHAATYAGYFTVCFAGDATYVVGNSATSLTVNPAPLTINAVNASKAYAATLPTFTDTFSGFVNGDTSTSLTTQPTLTTTATAASHVGTYAITAHGAAESDYTISYVAGILTVTPVPLTIIAYNASKTYGAALPTFTARYSGFVNGDTPASLTTQPTLSTTATSSSPVSGSPYVITAAAAVDADYTMSYVAGILVVFPAMLTVSAQGQSKVYDGSTAATVTLSDNRLPGDVFNDSYAAATIASTNVGTGQTVSVNGITISGPAAGNYQLVSTTALTTADITARAITVTATSMTKTYDGTTSATATPTVTAGSLAAGDTAAFSETFDTRNVGSGKVLTAAGSVNDGNGGSNYTVTFATNTTGSVTARAITVTAATSTKTYDATTSTTATPTVSSGALASGDTLAYTETYDTQNAGTGKTLTAAGSVADGNAGSNYTVSMVNSTGVIEQAPLTIAAITSTKTYDGTVTAGATPVVSGLQGGDSVSGLAENYADANAGTGKTLYVSDYTVNDGNSGGNYSVSLLNDSTGVINQANATILVTPYNVTYDGAAHTATGTATGVLGESLGGLDLSETTHTDAGTYNGDGWTFTDVTGNYTNASGTINDRISQALPTVSVAPLSTTYDGLPQGTGSETYGVGGVELGRASISYSTLDALAPVNVGSYTATGSYSGNINYLPATGTAAISIGQAGLTITAATNVKTYDATSTAEATPTVSGLQGNDSVSGLVETYADAIAGTGKTLYVTGYTVNDGNSGNNYLVTLVTDTTGQITPLAITVTAATATKTYDGSPSTTATPAITAGGLVAGDTAAFTETFDTKNAGADESLIASGSVNDGNGGSNYAVTFVTDTTGQITPLAITVTAATASKTYDGSTSTTATPAITAGGLVAGDRAAFIETFDTSNAGSDETLTAAGSVNDGNGGDNYTVSFVANTSGQIAARAITVTAASSTKNYDGTVSAAVTPAITGGSLAAGDVAAFSESYDNPNAGTGKTLLPGGSVNDGNGGNDYAVSFVVNATGAINGVTATAAKLIVTETSSSTVVSGHDVVYTITVKNAGPGAAQNVVLSDNLAASGLTYVSDPVPSGCTASTPPVGCTGMVAFTAPSLAAGASATFTLVAGVGSTAPSNSSLSNKVTVCCNTPLSGGSITVASVQAKVNAAGAGLVGSSLDTGQTDLVVTGTAGSDTIYVLPAPGNQILVLDDGRGLGPLAASTGRIVVYGGNGNDMVYISPLLTEPTWIFGGAGNDVFYAGSGNSVLVGGSGNNVLVSGRGDNLLIGGCGGHSTILGTQGNNVEIGGSVNCEANEAALAAILAEWSSSDSYAARIGRLDGTICGGLNGSWLLDANTIDHGTSGDYLFGGIGQNSYFARQTGPVLARDYIFGQKSLEQITSI